MKDDFMKKLYPLRPYLNLCKEFENKFDKLLREFLDSIIGIWEYPPDGLDEEVIKKLKKDIFLEHRIEHLFKLQKNVCQKLLDDYYFAFVLGRKHYEEYKGLKKDFCRS